MINLTWIDVNIVNPVRLYMYHVHGISSGIFKATKSFLMTSLYLLFGPQHGQGVVNQLKRAILGI